MADDVLVIRVGDPAPQVVGTGFDQAPSTIFVPLPQGPPGPAGPAGPAGPSGVAYVHQQSSPSAAWVINHGIGRLTGVALWISGELVFADITASINQTTITFPAPVTGTAILS